MQPALTTTVDSTNKTFDSAIDIIYENEQFFKSEQDIKTVLLDESKFVTFVQGLSSVIPDADTRRQFIEIAHFQRNALVNESEVIDNGTAVVAAVAYFPVIVDALTKPVLYSLVTPWKASNPQVKIPLLKRILELVGGNGEVLSTYELPLHEDPMGALRKSVTVNNASNVNLKTALKLPEGKYKVILSETYVTSIKYSYTDNAGNTQTGELPVTIPVQIKPTQDKATININVETVIDGQPVTFTGAVDIYDRSLIVSAAVNAIGGNNVKVESVTLNVMVTAADEASRFRLRYRLRREDIPFYVELNMPLEAEVDIWQQADMQNYYNVDYIAEVAKIMKRQVNDLKEFEIGRNITAYENEYLRNGAVATVDFNAMPPNLQPSNPADLFRYIIPAIIKVKNMIYRNTQVEPKYILVNPKTAYIIESLINMVAVPGTNISQLGVSADTVMSMSQFQVIKSDAIPEGKIYMYAKDTRNNPTLVDAILNAPIIRTKNDTTSTKILVVPQSKVVMVDPKKVGVINILNTPNV